MSFARSHSSRRNAVSSSRDRALRLEFLEPRLVLSTSLASAISTTLSATADAYVNSGLSTTNYGRSTDLLVESCNSLRGATMATYLKYDLSSVTGTISKATLNLTVLSVSSSSSVTLYVQLLKDSADSWSEGSGGINRSATGAITWANASSGYGLTVTISAANLKKGSTISIDVTKLLSQSFNTNNIASFVIRSTSATFKGTSVVDFASRECKTASYRPTLTITTSGNAPTVSEQATVSSQTSTTASLSVLGADTEDAESSLTYTWSLKSTTGSSSVTYSSNGTNAAKNTTVTFTAAGTYVFTVKITDSSGLSVTSTVTVTVSQELTAISISPSSVSLDLSESQTFALSGTDQFGKTMALTASSVAWSATAGSLSSTTGTSVTYVAPSSATTATVTATYGSLTASSTVTVAEANFLDLIDATLAALTESLDADGSISRSDMIAILTSIENESDGVVDSTDMSDLKTILSNATTLNIVSYVLVLADDIVYGNTANATYLGSSLGNLAVGSSNTKLEDLIDKWFYGTDLPVTSYSYDTSTSGTLFGSSGASHTDELQGVLGDCYLLAALGSIADSSSSAIENMFIDNGDGTWTVRFYYNGTADYVTVNSQLAVDSNGNLVYDGYGNSSTSSSNVLWLALLEKAYAQWNETGKTEQDDSSNSYAAIEGGWMGDVYEQVLGYTATIYDQSTTGLNAKQTLINAIAAGEAVTIGTRNFNYNSTTGLYGNHAYNVIAYNSSTGKFTLYNPWGSDQPIQLTWGQLQTYCSDFAATVTTGTVASSASVGFSLSNSLISLSSILNVSAAATSSSAAADTVSTSVTGETSSEQVASSESDSTSAGKLSADLRLDSASTFRQTTISLESLGDSDSKTMGDRYAMVDSWFANLADENGLEVVRLS
jgi:hypothetical protein